MTTARETALAEVAKLPPEEQEALASLLLEEIKSELKKVRNTEPATRRAQTSTGEHRASS